ncbi:hypothetical protein [Chitinibacter sp. S2-10]|uniref:hypothetical protein n=1 Tax=Chitinibacter sp. S2-10 TaxID=3373597 RepID=UPI0039778829
MWVWICCSLSHLIAYEVQHNTSNQVAKFSVPLHINEMVRESKEGFASVGYLPDNREEAAGFDEEMNRMLRSVRSGDYFYPAEEMLCSMLSDFAQFDTQQLSTVRQNLSDARRQLTAEVLLEHAQLMHPKEGGAMQAMIEQLLSQASKGKHDLH